jgi:undecaprenyl-diphosphatase
LPGDLLAARLLQGLPVPGGVAGALLSKADLAVWLVLVAALALTLLARSWSSAAFIFLASLGSVLLGIALKRIVARPRPSAELVHVDAAPQGYSFPSTTACLSVVLLGVIVYLTWRAHPPRSIRVVVLGAASALVLLIGLSRVYAGEHWATDVLGGWLFGAAWLLALTNLGWDPLRGRG